MEEMESEARALQVRLSDEQRQSLLDTLTRIPNRLAWEQARGRGAVALAALPPLSRWRRFHQPTCVLAWDIDAFKAINDRYGHRAGDKVLVGGGRVAGDGHPGHGFRGALWRRGIRDAAARHATRKRRSHRNQMREAIAQTGFHFRGVPVSVTISCGVTVVQERDTAEEVFDRADRAMYQAKNSGRNKVVSG